MQGAVIGLLADTFIHPGIGQADDTVDLPVARERTTRYPFVPGSGVKGATRDKYSKSGGNNETALFGGPDQGGRVRFSDASLVLLPVRSLTGAYRWLTCPHLIERYQRDCRRAIGKNPAANAIRRNDMASLVPGKAMVSTSEGSLFLEEHVFTQVAAPDLIDKLVELLKPLIADDDAAERLKLQLAIVTDDEITWFCERGLPVHARNELVGRKRSNNLWYEETLAPDTLLYTLVTPLEADALQSVKAMFDKDPYLQLGGNETVGQGWFQVAQITSGDGAGQ